MNIFKRIKQKIEVLPFFNSPFFVQHRQLVIPGLVLVVAILISVLVTIPQFLRLFETFKTIAELSEKKAFFAEKITTLKGIDEELYRKNLETALIALPVDKDVPGVTGGLLVALSSSGMSLNGINFAVNSVEGAVVSEYTLKMDISGQESDLRSFLDRIKLIPRIVKLTTLEVSKGRSETLGVTVSLVTLYQNLPENIGTVDEKVPQLTDADYVTLNEIKRKVDALPQTAVSEGSSSSSTGKQNPFIR